MLRGAALAVAVPIQGIIADGTSNRVESVTHGAPTEIELGPGVWAVSAGAAYRMQVNLTSGEGMGAHPVVRFTRQWRGVYVPPGQTRYLVIDPYYLGDTTLVVVNLVGGP